MSVVPATTAAESALGMALPHRRMEDWRWTDLHQLVDRPYPPGVAVKPAAAAVEKVLAASPFAGLGLRRIVFVDGRFDEQHSTLGNGLAAPLAVIDEPVGSMNASLSPQGARLVLEGAVDKPVELVFVATPGEARTIAVRNVLEVAAGASATIIETYLGEGDYLSNCVTEIRLGKGARLDRIKAECESAAAVHLSHAHVTMAKDAVLRDFTLTRGARLNRQNGTYVFAGENADARISGTYLLDGRQHADTRLVVDHAVPRCLSRELFKCVVDGNARGIFQGKVIVRQDAQKTDGKQSSHGLLLSETAEFDAKPELEIFADDVVCGHGATAGALNEDHMFYLRSRGIPESEARALLVAAFAAEAFDTVAHDDVREALSALVAGRYAA